MCAIMSCSRVKMSNEEKNKQEASRRGPSRNVEQVPEEDAAVVFSGAKGIKESKVKKPQ